MIIQFLFIGLPYAAIAAVVIGTYYRLTRKEYTVSSLSSQFLESTFLKWGSVPWHLGILVIFIGHLVPFLLPDLWADLVKHRPILIALEAVGFVAGVMCVLGLVVLIIRRIFTSTLQLVTKPLDFVVYVLLLSQILLGLVTAYSYRYGSVWAPGTVYAYLYGILRLSPDMTYVQDMPFVIQAHIALAWVILMLIPFTRLIHMFSIPLEYLFRLPQKVVWTNEVRWNRHSERAQYMESRRYFFRGVAGVTGAAGLLSFGVLEKSGHYFQGQTLDDAKEATLLEKRLKRMKLTAEEKSYELERLKNDAIFIADLKELQPATGKYFIDYEMRPALAFRDAKGLPNLLSAKCTHLGCTVGKDVDGQGRIVCPCHVSYFDIGTGVPQAGSPTEIPLGHIAWHVQAADGTVVAHGAPDGTITTTSFYDATKSDTYKVFIIKTKGVTVA